jgi:hypothetical protein
LNIDRLPALPSREELSRRSGQLLTHQPRSPDEIAGAFAEFEASERILRSPAHMKLYAGQWVAAHRGSVVAAAHNLPEIHQGLLRDRIPLSTTAIRFIEKDGTPAV